MNKKLNKTHFLIPRLHIAKTALLSMLSVFVLLSSSIGFCSPVLNKDDFLELKTFSILDEGEVLLVDFWASWCIPCRKSFPWLNEIQATYADKGLKILAINLDKDRALADKFLDKVPADFPIYYDSEARFAKSFDLLGMPSSYIVDDQGQILRSHKGFFEKKKDEYEKEIHMILEN